MKRTKEAFHW